MIRVISRQCMCVNMHHLRVYNTNHSVLSANRSGEGSMGRYWAIGALLLGCFLMSNACNYRCAPREHCEEESPIFDYRSKQCVAPEICCAIMRQNIYAPPTSSYLTRQDPPGSYAQTVQGGTPSAKRSGGPERLQPNGPQEPVSGQSGVKSSYGGASPPSFTPGGGYPTNDLNGAGNYNTPQEPVSGPSGVKSTYGGASPPSFTPGGGYPTNDLNGAGNYNTPQEPVSGPSGVKSTYGGASPPSFTPGGGYPTNELNGAGNYNTPRRDPTLPGGNSQPSTAGAGSQNYPEGMEQGQQCGRSNENGLQMMQGISQDHARPGQYPWAVALVMQKSYLAGGSLIRPGVVLTAAHRVVDKQPGELLVRAGDWDLKSNEEEFKAEQREVARIKIHEGFKFSSGANNLALLFLKTDFQLSDHIRTICLPDSRKSFEQRRCIVAGWGKIAFQDASFSSILKKLELPVLDRRTCQQQLRQTKMGRNYQLPESLICAGGEPNRDACSGDGGSALFCSVGGKNSGVFEQAGIVNWGLECGQAGVPATYTDVAMFKYWIDENLLPFRYRSPIRF
ncbi:inactive CLIP domain-containing serine protease A8 [Drosophila biarmipes]|uniref:inactive CLIP domain-containing serine protease A8 n=1 Tax=Drosophila biarmipes TaxID=125945 RepID=UPI001CDAB866|nr:inactive CLIP domain-containing serine protease A8 [Drosophila biarmipes]